MFLMVDRIKSADRYLDIDFSTADTFTYAVRGSLDWLHRFYDGLGADVSLKPLHAACGDFCEMHNEFLEDYKGFRPTLEVAIYELSMREGPNGVFGGTFDRIANPILVIRHGGGPLDLRLMSKGRLEPIHSSQQ